MKAAPGNLTARVATITVDRQLQCSLAPEERENRIFGLVDIALSSRPDLILLPEACWSYGLPWEQWATTVETRKSARVQRMQQLARKNECYIAIPILERRYGNIFNTLLLIDRSGKVAWHYDKMFLTNSDRELGIRPGDQIIPFEADFGRLGACICYDINFHELADLWKQMGVHMILFSSMFRGGSLVETWALLSESFIISAVSDEGSKLVDPLGKTLCRSSQYAPVIMRDIPRDFAVMHIDENEKQWSNLREKYGSRIHLEISSEEGRFILESRDRNLTVASLIKKHDLKPLGLYLSSARKKNAASSKLITKSLKSGNCRLI